jgi:hypothetical protein
MCFSAAASFGASALLACAGIVTLRTATTPAQTPFAAIPLLFAVQQFTEGVLWVALPDAGSAQLARLATYVFLFFAQVVWPTWLPLSILLISPRSEHARTLQGLLALGAVLSAYLAGCLLWNGATADVLGHHIHYRVDYPPALLLASSAIYGLVTIVPPLICGGGMSRLLGSAIAFSYVVTVAFYEVTVISVWCYFAAVLSALVYGVLVSADAGPDDRRAAPATAT